MNARPALQRVLLGREVVVAFAIIVVLYLIRFVRFQPFQIPAYLLIVTYDLVEVALPVLTPYYPVVFPLFLYCIAIIGGAVARWFRPDTHEQWAIPRAAGGVSIVIGIISLLFGAYIGGPLVAPADNPTPLAILSTTGVVLLVIGWWLLSRPIERSNVAV